MDTFHGHYKDGTKGTQDYRAVSGYILAMWAFLPVATIITNSRRKNGENNPTLHLLIIFFVVLTVLCASLKPYKYRAANIGGVILPANIVVASIFLALSAGSITVMVIRESVDSLCRDGARPPVVCVHWKSVLTRDFFQTTFLETGRSNHRSSLQINCNHYRV